MSNLHGWFDTAIIVGILLVDSLALYVAWRGMQLREKDRIRRRFKTLLIKMGFVHETR